MFFISSHPMDPIHKEQLRECGATYLGELGPFHIKRAWLTFNNVQWLKRTLRENKIDVVHCHFLGANAWYAAVSGFHPLVLTIMGGGDVCGPDWAPRTRVEKLFTPLTLGRADLITSWSALMGKVVRPYCREGTPIRVVHGGIELSHFHNGPKPTYLLERWNLPANAKVVFSPRLMRPLSNIHTIAEAMRAVLQSVPDSYFLFVYPTYARDADYEQKVREIIEKNNAMEHARFVGAIPHNEMADHYRLADVTVSIPGTDGTPMSVLESMACGTPVVVGAIPDYDEEYIQSGSTVLAAKTDDSNDVARAIVRLINEQGLIRQLTTEARRRVELSGSYQSQMSRMDQHYKELFI
jgi:glycosyltransferase involved in cell wall biosynthesis